MDKKISKKNRYISYIKGLAFFIIFLIHLFDWGGLADNSIFVYFRKIFYPGLSIFIFVAMSGSLIYLAYRDYDLKKVSKRLLIRGLKFIGIYYLFSIVKLFLFDFSKQDLYSQFIGSNRTDDLINILTLKKSDTGIAILFTIGAFLIISPILLYFTRKSKHPGRLIFLITLFFIILSIIITPNSSSYLYNLLYSNNFATFPLFLWIIPYLLGMFVAIIGFEKRKKIILFVSSILSFLYIIFFFITDRAISPKTYAYQLPDGSIKYYIYFVLFSFMVFSIFMYLLKYIIKINKKWSNKILYILEFVGDRTFDIYLIQWVMIDLTYLLFSPNDWMVFITVPISVCVYCFIKYKKVKQKIIN